MSVKFICSLLLPLLASSLLARAQVSEDLQYIEHDTSITITRCSQLAEGRITIPPTIKGKPVTELRDAAFSMCDYLTNVDIQAPITTIGHQTFYSCRKLQGIKLPPTLRNIGSEAFFNCESLADMTIPGKVAAIGDQAFAYCALKTVVFPASLKTVGDYAFLTCQDLKKATFLGNAPRTGTGFFNEAPHGFTIYFHEGRSGFTTPTWRGFPSKRLSPEIAVHQPLKTNLTDGISTRDFGRTKTGQTGGSRTFTIRNTGKLALTGINVSLTGKQARHFILTPPKQTTIEPGSDARFKITFKPRAAGSRKAVVRIKSNDRDESSFEVGLTGTGG